MRGYGNKGESHHHKLKINVGSKFSVQPSNHYQLSCEGAKGEVHYRVDGLPEGATLKGDKIHVSSNVKAGNYHIRIRAEDDSGAIAEKIITLSVIHQEVAGSSSTSSTNSASSSSTSSTSQ